MTFRVLVFPGGTEIGLEINRALRNCKEVELFSAGIANSNHAPFVFQHHFELPSIHQEGWLEALNTLVKEQSIDFIFPAYDDIIVTLATNAHRIKSKIITSPLETCLITRSKVNTYRFFADILPIPNVYSDIAQIEAYPVFVKPDIGQGSQGAVIANSYEQLYYLLNESGSIGKSLVITEYLSGIEYTVDCFSHRSQGLLFSAGRERIRTKSGISMASRHVSNPIFHKYAQIISQHLQLYGAWFFQVKQAASGEYKLLEVAPRIAGTMALSRVNGVNFPLLSLYESLDKPVQIMLNRNNVEIDRALINRYHHQVDFAVLYIDLDDMLIVNGRLNLDAIRLIYQCINQGKRVVLLTRHKEDLDITLRRFRISTLFDEIIHVPVGQQKATLIREQKAVFVDDSFQERQSVEQHCHIPTFDSSMIEMLFDDRA